MNVRVYDGNVIDARRLGMRGVECHDSGRGRGARQKRAAAYTFPHIAEIA
jgi:hypothetical protein